MAVDFDGGCVVCGGSHDFNVVEARAPYVVDGVDTVSLAGVEDDHGSTHFGATTTCEIVVLVFDELERSQMRRIIVIDDNRIVAFERGERANFIRGGGPS